MSLIMEAILFTALTDRTITSLTLISNPKYVSRVITMHTFISFMLMFSFSEDSSLLTGIRINLIP